MQDRIKAIEEYLKYYPESSEARGKINLCRYAQELGIKLNGSYYPRMDYDRFVINDLLYATKRCNLSNHATSFVPNEEDTLVIWYASCGRLDFVGDDYWHAIEKEWKWLHDKLKEYNPLDYDEINNKYIFDVENGKRLIEDYAKITDELKTMLKKKILVVETEKKKRELERLQKELEGTNTQ